MDQCDLSDRYSESLFIKEHSILILAAMQAVTLHKSLYKGDGPKNRPLRPKRGLHTIFITAH